MSEDTNSSTLKRFTRIDMFEFPDFTIELENGVVVDCFGEVEVGFYDRPETFACEAEFIEVV